MKFFKQALPDIFKPYQFELQQYVSNCREIDDSLSDVTEPMSETENLAYSEPVRLLGMYWYREADSLSNIDMKLNPNASTKREILKSIAKNFDIFNILLPLRNRAKMFMQELQLEKTVKWDDTLNEEYLREVEVDIKSI